MDEPREGTVLFLVNYLSGASNLRTLYYKWSESGICRAPSPFFSLLQASHLQASLLFMSGVLVGSPMVCGCLSLKLLWLLGRTSLLET